MRPSDNDNDLYRHNNIHKADHHHLHRHDNVDISDHYNHYHHRHHHIHKSDHDDGHNLGNVNSDHDVFGIQSELQWWGCGEHEHEQH